MSGKTPCDSRRQNRFARSRIGATTFSFLLWLGFAALCVRSYWQYDRIHWESAGGTTTGWTGNSDDARSIHGFLIWDHLNASLLPGKQPYAVSPTIQWVHRPIQNTRATREFDAPSIRWFGLGEKRVSSTNATYSYVSRSLLIPYWIPLLLSGALPASAGLRRIRRHLRQRRSSDRCRSCGYDLTANTSGVCPECGNSFAVGSESLI